MTCDRIIPIDNRGRDFLVVGHEDEIFRRATRENLSLSHCMGNGGPSHNKPMCFHLPPATPFSFLSPLSFSLSTVYAPIRSQIPLLYCFLPIFPQFFISSLIIFTLSAPFLIFSCLQSTSRSLMFYIQLGHKP